VVGLAFSVEGFSGSQQRSLELMKLILEFCAVRFTRAHGISFRMPEHFIDDRYVT
jgi:hypothetical protein